ncbi:MAG TPA: FAD-binding protein [Edaphobacter sp.]|nr:FAD-binding protein [Edaphobacter sp.]
MAIETVNQQDPRFTTLNRGNNARFPPTEADAASRIVLCDNANDVAEALQKIVSAGLRPTVRSGGHCYEDFVYTNPKGAIIDLSLFNETTPVAGAPAYRIAAGTQLGDAYTELYKRHGVTLPGGSCESVGAGGHITGGGYGVLSRLHGITPDWVTAVDILTVDKKGQVVPRRVDAKHDPDLFRACRGAGGGNFGIITNFYFDKLPPAPKEVTHAGVRFDWNGMTQERFTKILQTYGHFLETRGNDPDTWGLFAIIGLSHASAGSFGVNVQFCNPDGTCKDLKVLNEFLDLFENCNPSASEMTNDHPAVAERMSPQRPGRERGCLNGKHRTNLSPWFNATVRGNGGSFGETRSKYKSAYMKRNFSVAETVAFYKHMHRTIPGTDLRGSMVLMDAYGGAVNRKELIEETAVHQRSSVMKLQFLSYWRDPAEDAGHMTWMRDIYTDVYSGPDTDAKHKGTPYPNDHYEGCYINYPDKDMLEYSFWPELYYGDQGLYPFLQSVKRQYDPNNVFHHAMSVRA